MVHIPRLVRGDLGGFTNEESGARDEAVFFEELAPYRVGGVFSWFKGALYQLDTGKWMPEH